MLARFVSTLLGVLLLAGCASLSPRVDGQTDVVAWQATDLKLEQAGLRRLWSYSFNLLITETRGVAVTFSEIELLIYQPGAGSWSGRYRGSWKLDARDQFRIPLSATLSCYHGVDACVGPNVPIPLWRVLMQGVDDRGQPAKTVIDITLPADPPAVPARSSASVRELTLVPPKR